MTRFSIVQYGSAHQELVTFDNSSDVMESRKNIHTNIRVVAPPSEDLSNPEVAAESVADLVLLGDGVRRGVPKAIVFVHRFDFLNSKRFGNN